MMSLPVATRIQPLTQETFAQLLERSANPRLLRGCCSGHEADRAHIAIPNNTNNEIAAADLLAIHLAMQARRQYYFALKEPDLASQYGPYFNTVFYHPELQNYVKEQLRNADGDLWVDLTATENDFKATIVSPLDRTYVGNSETFAFADNASPVFTWVKPVHNEAFLRRAVPALMQNVFGKEMAHWGSNSNISLCNGVYLFAREGISPKVIAVVDLSRHAVKNDPRVAVFTNENIAMLTVPELEGNSALRFYKNGDERFLPYLKRFLSTELGIELPSDSEIRYFFWQRYVEE